MSESVDRIRYASSMSHSGKTSAEGLVTSSTNYGGSSELLCIFSLGKTLSMSPSSCNKFCDLALCTIPTRAVAEARRLPHFCAHLCAVEIRIFHKEWHMLMDLQKSYLLLPLSFLVVIRGLPPDFSTPPTSPWSRSCLWSLHTG